METTIGYPTPMRGAARRGLPSGRNSGRENNEDNNSTGSGEAATMPRRPKIPQRISSPPYVADEAALPNPSNSESSSSSPSRGANHNARSSGGSPISNTHSTGTAWTSIESETSRDGHAASSVGEAASTVVGAARLPQENLYESLVRAQEEHDGDDAGSLPSETLRSVSTWYSVRSDDDRKIPARPSEGTYEGTYREPIRRSYLNSRPPNGVGNNSRSSGSSSSNTEDQGNPNLLLKYNNMDGKPKAVSPHHHTNHLKTVVSSDVAAGELLVAPSPGPPSVVYQDEKDDHTTMSSLACSNSDSLPIPAARLPLAVLEETAEFACLTPAAQLAAESQMGNIVETTRSAPSPHTSAIMNTNDINPDGPEWAIQQWSLQNMNRRRNREPLTTTTSTRSIDPSPNHHHRMSRSSNKKSECGGSTALSVAASTATTSSATTVPRDSTRPTTTIDPMGPGDQATTSRSMRDSSNDSGTKSPTQPTSTSDYARMQETLGMQHLTASSNPPTNSSITANPDAGVVSSHLLMTGTDKLHQSHPSGIRVGHSSSNSSCTASVNNVDAASGFVGGRGGGIAVDDPVSDPAAKEQLQIWKQIQAELEQKEMKLALQLSQTASGNRNKNVNDKTNDASGAGEEIDEGDFLSDDDEDLDYPDQQAKDEEEEEDSEEDAALKEALRISKEEAAAAEAARVQRTVAGDEDEDEIALALRLSKEQAEADQKRFQQLQQTSGELSEEEQLRLAMEQSMQVPRDIPNTDDDSVAEQIRRALEESMQQPNQRGSGDGDSDEQVRRALEESLQPPPQSDDDNETVDSDIKLAMRLSQVQLEEEEQYRHSYLQGKRHLHAGNRGESPVSHDTRPDNMMSGRSSMQRFPNESLPQPQPLPMPRASQNMSPPRHHDPPPQVMSHTHSGAERDFIMGPGGEPHRSTSMNRNSAPHPNSPYSDPYHHDHRDHPTRSRSGGRFSAVHRPDDASDTPPVGRVGWQQEYRNEVSKPNFMQQQQMGYKEFPPDLDRDTREVLVREGQNDTRVAIMQGQSKIVTCQGCLGQLHAPAQCAMVYCPNCNSVTPV